MFHVPEQYRIKDGDYGSDESYGNNGAFRVPVPDEPDDVFMIIASDGEQWEHVSVHVVERIRIGLKITFKTETPLWSEMCYIKSLFWDSDDVVMQLHPAEKDYVNIHEDVLHLWRPVKEIIPLPPKEMV